MFRTVFDHASDGMFLVDLDTKRFFTCNAACARMLGYGIGEFAGLDISDIHPVEDLPFIFEQIAKFAQGEQGERSDIRFRRRDGSVFYADINPALVSVEGHRFLLISFRDITDRKTAEKAVTDSEQKFRSLFDSSPDGLLLADSETGRFVMANAAILKLTGYAPAELYRLSVIDLVPPERRPSAVEQFKKHVRGETALSSDVVVHRKDGTTFIADISSTPITMQSRKFQLGIFRDVTGRRQAEKAVQESEEKYRNLVDRANDGIAIVQDEVFRFANPGLARIWGGSVDEIAGLPFTAILPPDERERLVDRHRKRFAGEPVPPIYETALLRRDGTRFPAEINAGLVTYGGRPADLIIIRDITERKRAEEALRDSRQILAGILNTIPVRVFWKDKNLTYLGCNVPFARDAGFENPEDIIGKDDYAMGWRDQAELYRADDRAVIESRKSKLMIEEPQTTPAGESIILLTNKVPLLDAKGEVIGVLGTYLDITERKRAEKALQESERRYRSLFENMLDGYALCRMLFDEGRPSDFVYLDVNPAFERLTGLSGVAGKKVSEVIPGIRDSNPELFEIYGRVAATGRPERFETYVPALGIWFSISVFSPEREHFVAVFDNITERKRAEEALRESEEMFRNPVERSTVGVFLVQDGTIQYANPRLAEMAGYFGEPMAGTLFEPMILPGDLPKVQEAMGRLARGETPAEHVEFRAREKNGAIREVEAYGSSMIYHGRPAIFGTLIDITERKRMEGQIAASLNEKEVMLREIHHRVKNNLQIVNSLMNLQIQKVGDPATVSALTDTQARVRAMSLVHERLYKTRELSRIDLKDYITKLAEELMRSQKVTQKVGLDLRLQGISLDINLAIPVGLILNEILTNSLKYAFPDGRDGKISISAEREPSGLVIRIGDDGVGILAGFDWQKSNTLGMKLIHGLVSQVNGTITMERDGGTRYEIRIPEPKASAAEVKAEN
ncbi:MAG TPA: PAS domain S-box protein [Methanomicrobiales archaeon]|nr:PAS domain S-box protein [Methanomicrobiales archaeon]